MATAMESSDFEGWLSEKLEKLNMDQEVFGSYILGIMESDDSTEEDKTEALTDILSEISEDTSVEEVCHEIFQQWNKTNQEKLAQQNNAKLQSKEDTEAKMVSIMEKHATTQEVKREVTTEDRERKAALVAQYGEVSESDEESEDDAEAANDNSGEATNKTPKAANPGDCQCLCPTPTLRVSSKSRRNREKNKQDHAKRREMEKAQREQQQQKTQDRKDKEKKRTQKQERKR